MSIRNATTCLIALGLTGTMAGFIRTSAGQQADDVQVQIRGPVHEAFAEPVVFDPDPGIVIDREPPAPVEELPPDQKPDGDDVAWISGYWSWDDDRRDFLWVSGIWRLLPPGRQWVGGYWRPAGQQHQWVSGYWATTNAAAIDYLPQPPRTLETGPNVPAPSGDHFWVSGCWMWTDNRYFWRPGYWTVAQPGWIWTPAHYSWTPCGYVYVDGYWDYSIRRRGLLFAPIYVNRVAYSRPGFFYTPRYVINVDVVTDDFFCRPSYRHYYFGDYYSAQYYRLGIQPWFSFHYSRVGYDPIFSYYHWHYSRYDRDWRRECASRFDRRREHAAERPPQTLAEQAARPLAGNNTAPVALAKPLTELAATTDAPVRLRPIDPERRKEAQVVAKKTEQMRAVRRRMETEAAEQLVKSQLSASPAGEPGPTTRTSDETNRPPAREGPQVAPLVNPTQTGVASSGQPPANKPADESSPAGQRTGPIDSSRPRESISATGTGPTVPVPTASPTPPVSQPRPREKRQGDDNAPSAPTKSQFQTLEVGTPQNASPKPPMLSAEWQKQMRPLRMELPKSPVAAEPKPTAPTAANEPPSVAPPATGGGQRNRQRERAAGPALPPTPAQEAPAPRTPRGNRPDAGSAGVPGPSAPPQPRLEPPARSPKQDTAPSASNGRERKAVTGSGPSVPPTAPRPSANPPAAAPRTQAPPPTTQSSAPPTAPKPPKSDGSKGKRKEKK